MRNVCTVCGRDFVSKRPDAVTCSPSCRSRKRRVVVPDAPPAGVDLVSATRRELEAAGKVETMLGQQALALASRMLGTDTPAGVASLSRELRAVMAAAVGAAAKPAPKADSVDELRTRRDAKRTG